MDYGISGESIICFAGEDWWYHHPHSKYHILKRLAQQNRVLFVNSLSMGLPSVSNPDFFLKIRRKLKSYARWLKKVPEGLWVMTPIVLPFYGSPWAQKLNRVLLSLQLRIAMRHCGMSKPIVWVAIPSAADAADLLRPKLVIYQVSDKYDANEDSALSKDVIRELHRRLIDMAGAVLFSGRRLFDEADDPAVQREQIAELRLSRRVAGNLLACHHAVRIARLELGVATTAHGDLDGRQLGRNDVAHLGSELLPGVLILPHSLHEMLGVGVGSDQNLGKSRPAGNQRGGQRCE